MSQSKRQLFVQYGKGARNATNILLEAVLFHKLQPEAAMHLLVAYSQVLEKFVKKRDFKKPLVIRAVSKALDELGIEKYDEAFQRILSQKGIHLVELDDDF